MKNIAIFASGSGTNAENIIKYFSNGTTASVCLVLSNRRDAYVIKRAASLNVQSVFFDRKDFYERGTVMNLLRDHRIDFIVLAGFLWLVPSDILTSYENRIVNIHPALLPGYGGRGMYGDRVHEAVIRAGEKESGITIHYVNSEYDAGDIIFQAVCPVLEDDTPADVAARVHALEYKHYPVVIEELVSKLPELP
ncbi:MAG: phosphoribosylglycinamide formyltransferase [Bacteroidales bacterium]|jgi:phosphoribosylglycinamide formyltransferase-1|nr:phosphoribosylglycinamide formyltransferase [Bacteroidales bacterium]